MSDTGKLGMCDLADSHHGSYRIHFEPHKERDTCVNWREQPAVEPACGECVISVIAGASWIPCALPKGHGGGHRGEGNCVKHGKYMGQVGQFPQCPAWPECIQVGAEPAQGEPLSLLVKLGSIVVHVDEMLSSRGHDYDRIAVQQLISDPEVQQLLSKMTKMALLPVKR